MNSYMRWFVLFLLAVLMLAGSLAASSGISLPSSTLLAPDEMNYHDFAETEAALRSLDAHSPYVTLETIGESIDYRTNPASPTSYPIYALRVSANTPEASGDRYNRNAILFDCDTHAREWLTSESCLALADYLVHHRIDDASPVPELLMYTDVWIIPMVNPAGRVIDDPAGGDPTQFFNNPLFWSGRGWRNNADTRLCTMGVNVARNFSRGFNDAHAVPFCDSEYRGFAPFSTGEANALRQFVNNHMISMAVTAHSNGQEIWNEWDAGDIAGSRMIDQAALTWRQGGWTTATDQARYDLARGSVGHGNGQFSAWLSNTSNHSGNDDDHTIGPWAYPGDLPLAGDFDSDGQADDVAIYRTPAVGDQYHWYYDYNHDGDTDENRGPWAEQPGDRPFAGDFDGDGAIDDVAFYRASDHTWQYDYNHDANPDEIRSGCGTSCLHPIALDYDRDGAVDDRAAFCTTDKKWYFDINHDCVGDGITPVGPWGLTGDLPLGGDFDRDGEVDDLAVYRPSNRMWYYDLDHNGTTDHASGPWGTAEGLPVAGNFNPGGDDPDRLDDVGLFTPSTRQWHYDDYHNATFPQLDDGTRRGIQTIMLELPVLDDIYDTSMYIQSAGDGSNGFHPSANAVHNMINDAFVPMGLYLIRQARAPGCPTASNASAESAYCPALDAGLIGAKIIPYQASDDSPGVLRSVQAQRASWSDVTPALEQLDTGVYRVIYRVQNFSTTSATYSVTMTVNRWTAAASGTRTSTPLFSINRLHTLAGRTAASDDFDLLLFQPAQQRFSYADTVGDHYEIVLEVAPSAGGSDGFGSNDSKIFKFQVLGSSLFLPVGMR